MVRRVYQRFNLPLYRYSLYHIKCANNSFFTTKQPGMQRVHRSSLGGSTDNSHRCNNHDIKGL